MIANQKQQIAKMLFSQCNLKKEKGAQRAQNEVEEMSVVSVPFTLRVVWALCKRA